MTCDPVFSTHTQIMPVIPGQGLFMLCLLSPSWDSNDASFIAPKSSPAQGDSSTESPTRNINYVVKRCPSSTIYSVVLHYGKAENSNVTHIKNLSLAKGLLGCGLGLTIKLSAWNIPSLWKHEIYGKSFCENWSSKMFNCILRRHRSLWYALASSRDWKLSPVVAELI